MGWQFPRRLYATQTGKVESVWEGWMVGGWGIVGSWDDTLWGKREGEKRGREERKERMRRSFSSQSA